MEFPGLLGQFFLINLLEFVHSIPIPNGVIGFPEIQCGAKTIGVVFKTQDAFKGRVFVGGHSADPECTSAENGRRTTSIHVSKFKCGVVSLRSNNPAGILTQMSVVISFHKKFVTKVDRGYEVSCLYMESEKILTYPLSISASDLEGVRETAEMPSCKYEVLDSVSRQPVSVVAVGEKLLHKWSCDSPVDDLWCMAVYNCFVEDGQNTEALLIDEYGCAVDKFLLGNLDYGPGDLTVQKEAHAFKFADRVAVNFQCSIRLYLKEDTCLRPQCEGFRRKRHVSIKTTSETDVRKHLEVLDQFPQSRKKPNVKTVRKKQSALGSAVSQWEVEGRNFCISVPTLFIPSALCVSVVLCFLVTAVIISRHNYSIFVKSES